MGCGGSKSLGTVAVEDAIQEIKEEGQFKVVYNNRSAQCLSAAVKCQNPGRDGAATSGGACKLRLTAGELREELMIILFAIITLYTGPKNLNNKLHGYTQW